MNPRAIVAIILALCVLTFVVVSAALHYFGVKEPGSEAGQEQWKSTLAAIIGALSVYIAGGSKDK